MNRQSNALFIHNMETTRKLFLPHEQIADYYFIDIYGNVYSTLLGSYLKPYVNTKGYLLISLQAVDSRRIQERVHRMVKYTFDYIPGCENLQIDHIDGNKANNYIGNLEWVTAKENSRRRDLNCQKTESLAEIDKLHVLNLIAKGYSDEQIIDIVPNATIMKIGELLQGRYKNIPKDLVLDARKVRSEQIRISHRTTLNEDQMHLICGYFQTHKPPYDSFEENLYNKRRYLEQAMLYCGFDYHDKNQRNMCLRLLNRQCNSIITDQYIY